MIISQFPITVDYRKTVHEMIEAGRYDHVYLRPGDFPIKGDGVRDAICELFHVEAIMDAESIVGAMRARGLRPAQFEELLAFGASYPDEQRGRFIGALGSINSAQQNPMLVGSERFRNLQVIGRECDWSQYGHLLGTRI